MIEHIKLKGLHWVRNDVFATHKTSCGVYTFLHKYYWVKDKWNSEEKFLQHKRKLIIDKL